MEINIMELNMTISRDEMHKKACRSRFEHNLMICSDIEEQIKCAAAKGLSSISLISAHIPNEVKEALMAGSFTIETCRGYL
jgi:hypothetical protein